MSMVCWNSLATRIYLYKLTHFSGPLSAEEQYAAACKAEAENRARKKRDARERERVHDVPFFSECATARFAL